MFKPFRSAFLAAALVAATFAAASSPAPVSAQTIINGRDASTGAKRAVDVGPNGVLRATDSATIFASAAVTATATSADFANYSARGVVLVLDVTAATGTTPTLDCKVRLKDTLSAKYVDLAGAAFAQKTGANTWMLVIYPGVAESANVAKSSVITDVWDVVCTIGGTTPSFTFSLGAHYID